jgi:hypothetical protein
MMPIPRLTSRALDSSCRPRLPLQVQVPHVALPSLNVARLRALRGHIPPAETMIPPMDFAYTPPTPFPLPAELLIVPRTKTCVFLIPPANITRARHTHPASAAFIALCLSVQLASPSFLSGYLSVPKTIPALFNCKWFILFLFSPLMFYALLC